MVIFFLSSLDSFLGPIGKYEGLRTVYDDTVLDRMAHYYTVIILCFYTMFSVTEEFLCEPIKCWFPEEFSESEENFAHYVCWVSNTYYIPFSKPVPPQFEPRRQHEITYYQWVPMVMLIMAFCFKFPRHLWKYMAQKSGVDVKRMLEMTVDTMDASTQDRETNIKHVAMYIDSWCSGVNTYRGGIFALTREKYQRKFETGYGRHYGNYLVTLALTIKFLYLLNAILQLFFLNEFLGGNDFYVYGYEVIYHVFIQGKWPGTHRFPTVTLCDFDLRQITNVQRFTLQCVLPVNFFNEKFFIFLWFWISLVVICSAINFIRAIFLILHSEQKVFFTRKYLLMNFPYDEKNYHMNKLVRKFTENHLRQDGIFLLKLVSDNSSTVFVSDVVMQLWELYLKRIYKSRLDKRKQCNGKKSVTVYLAEPSVYESCV
ncbi:hypothetical protein FSP39_005191 [Pinctada imbricata]|uniref:Innexin n=1 Tax=Pinctada imbricata TaxID=66713 RepID=A0AA88XDN0_PINIB|nr:hypothetical protein FSP39_005191 [Pinctada imbricata]